MKGYVEIFKSLSDETRLRIFYLLIKTDSELCCCELTDSLEAPQYNVSRHLKILKNAGLVEERKEGRWIYSFIPKKSSQFKKMLIKTISSMIETKRLKKDLENLNQRLKLRKNDKCIFGIQKSHLLSRKKQYES